MRRRTPSQVQTDEIYAALVKPASSYREILDRVNASRKARGIPLASISTINTAIYRLRKADINVYCWTIPHCRRGKSQPGRLYRHDPSSPKISEAKVDASIDGVRGTLSHIAHMGDNSKKMMSGFAPQIPDTKLGKRVKDILRRTGGIVEDARFVLEELKEAGWG